MTSVIIDIHPHIISPDTAKYPSAPLGGVQSDWSMTRPVSFEQLVREMDETGVAKAAIVHASTCYGFDNSYVADSVDRLPHRFIGVYAIDVLAPDAVARIEYWRQRGMAGLRLFSSGSTIQTDGRWMTRPQTLGTWEHMARIGMPVSIQTTAEGLPSVVELLERFPDVNIILDHLARPTLNDGPPYKGAASLFTMARFPNLYLKVTPRTFTLAQQAKASPDSFFPRLVREFGAHRLAFGSNYPTSEGPLSKLIAQGHACFAALTDDERSWIWARTAQSLYPELAD
ncbi:MAG TPA: amidohydrolase family protein [Devosia sp.]|nr:amidohydrolase family protein [Devosia sp.]